MASRYTPRARSRLSPPAAPKGQWEQHEGQMQAIQARNGGRRTEIIVHIVTPAQLFAHTGRRGAICPHHRRGEEPSQSRVAVAPDHVRQHVGVELPSLVLLAGADFWCGCLIPVEDGESLAHRHNTEWCIGRSTTGGERSVAPHRWEGATPQVPAWPHSLLFCMSAT